MVKSLSKCLIAKANTEQRTLLLAYCQGPHEAHTAFEVVDHRISGWIAFFDWWNLNEVLSPINFNSPIALILLQDPELGLFMSLTLSDVLQTSFSLWE
uniref:Uncharacterized protein n=1 Tax=Rhizophora mucronata TaxID=61149 RepID=A0A2P2NM38_RHIMU